MAQQIFINPIDLELDMAIGIDLPMIKPYGSNFAQTYLTIDAAYANARNLLLTNTGERIMQPTLGCDLRRTIFEINNPQLVDNLDARIRGQFNFWLPYIFINELTITSSEDLHKIFIKLLISLKGNEFDTRSILLEINTGQ